MRLGGLVPYPRLGDRAGFKVGKRHRNVLRFLWWQDGDIKVAPVEYRMTVHLFGAGSSPGCVSFALKIIATDHEEEFGHDAANFVMQRQF